MRDRQQLPPPPPPPPSTPESRLGWLEFRGITATEAVIQDDQNEILSHGGESANQAVSESFESPRTSVSYDDVVDMLWRLGNGNPALELDPADGNIRVHGQWEASRRAQTLWVKNAAKMIRVSEEFRQSFFNVAQQNRRTPFLERALLNFDISRSEPLVRKVLAQTSVFIVLNLQGEDTSPHVHEYLQRGIDDVLDPLQNDPNMPIHFSAVEGPVEKGQADYAQTASLLRALYEFARGKMGHRDFNKGYSASENARLICSALGIEASARFGHFDPERMRDTLQVSQVFVGVDIRTRDLVKWSTDLIDALPIGFRKDHLHLPSQVLYELGLGQVDRIDAYIKQCYHRLPSLQMPENNILLLLIWNSENTQQTSVIDQWAKSSDGLTLYLQLIKKIKHTHELEQLTLDIAALRCLPFLSDERTNSIDGCFLSDLDALLRGREINNGRVVLDKTIISMKEVLSSFQHQYENLIQILNGVVGQVMPSSEPSDILMVQYIIRRIDGESHQPAAEAELAHVKLLMHEVEEQEYVLVT